MAENILHTNPRPEANVCPSPLPTPLWFLGTSALSAMPLACNWWGKHVAEACLLTAVLSQVSEAERFSAAL